MAGVHDTKAALALMLPSLILGVVPLRYFCWTFQASGTYHVGEKSDF